MRFNDLISPRYKETKEAQPLFVLYSSVYFHITAPVMKNIFIYLHIINKTHSLQYNIVWSTQILLALRGRHPLWGTGVLSVIETTSIPPILRPLIADWR